MKGIIIMNRYLQEIIEKNRCLLKTDIPEWMKKGKTTLIEKDSPKKEPLPTTTDQ